MRDPLPYPASRMSTMRHGTFHAALVVSLTIAVCCNWARADSPAASAAHFQLERGWQVPGTGFTLGGYATEDLTREKGAPWALTTEDLSLFIGWEGTGRLKFFSELSLEDSLVFKQPGEFTVSNHSPAFERIYFDYVYSERWNLRLGKFLTPIGRWNLIHADPLVWTTSRPLITNRPFPTYATGAMLYGTTAVSGKDIDYSLYATHGRAIRTYPMQDSFESAYGLHLSGALPGSGQIGFSYANFAQGSAPSERKTLFGVDYSWVRDRFELSSEAVYRFSSRGHQWDEKGAFIQAVAPLPDRLYGVGRYEYFRQAGALPGVSLWTAGLAFRITPTSVLKAEFVHGVNNEIHAPEGFLSSISVLF
ncbi:MAG: hypothetical protein ACYC9Z_03060 [Casimicrobiaceae bacterium]